MAEKKKTKAKKSPKTKTKKEGLIKSIRKEMKLVRWPSGKEVVKYSIATIIFCLVMCAFFLLLIFALSSIVKVF